MTKKERIRQTALAKRERLSKEERAKKSRIITERIISLEEYAAAEDILVYVSYKSEVDTKVLIETALRDGKRVYCPKVCGREMEFYRIDRPEELQAGYKGILEPEAVSGRLFAGGKRCLMLMPGAAFDKERNRIGYGGGYYDRYLQKRPFLPTAAIGFSCQIVERIPAESYDIKPDRIITEEIYLPFCVLPR